jgi:hypothetical protein
MISIAKPIKPSTTPRELALSAGRPDGAVTSASDCELFDDDNCEVLIHTNCVAAKRASYGREVSFMLLVLSKPVAGSHSHTARNE